MAARSLVLLCCMLAVASAQLSSVNIDQVVRELAQRFEQIRNDGLGVNALENEYRRAQFNFDTLTQAQIEDLLSSPSLNNPVDSVVSLFDNIVRDTNSATFTPAKECCDQSRTGSDTCCYFCDFIELPHHPERLQRIANLFNSYDDDDTTLFFGDNDGRFYQHPPPSLNNCTIKSPRLQQWYTRVVGRPLEVVIVMDSYSFNSALVSEENIAELQQVAFDIMRSLTQQDRVAVVRHDRNTQVPFVISRLSNNVNDPRTVPVCDDIIVELEQFVTSVTENPAGNEVNHTQGFLTGLGLFSDSNDTDKVLVSIVTGLANSGFSDSVAALRNAVDSNPNLNIVVSSYRYFDDGFQPSTFSALSQISLNGGSDWAIGSYPDPISFAVGSYNDRPMVSVMNTALVAGRAVTSSRESILTLTQPIANGSSLIGVLHAELPWEKLLLDISARLANRGSSYVFAFNPDGELIFHPLLPGNVLKDVLVSEIEPQAPVNVNSVTTVTVRKTVLFPITATETNGFVVREVPGNYHCSYNGVINICLFLADEDITVATLDRSNVNTRSVYSSSSSRLPLYHALSLSAPSSSFCDYFCKASLTNRLSFQLTPPNSPPNATQTIVEEVSNYIRGTGDRPSWVVEGVAEDIALGSAVASSWFSTGNTASDYISRRHLATPSGAYLTYPPTQLNEDYRPLNSGWYTSSRAHPSLITLTPPQEGLGEGSRLSVSVGYAVKTPSSESDNRLDGSNTLAVVAAEVSVDALRAFVRQSMPLCEASDTVSCFILDDFGNIVYDEVVTQSVFYRGGAMFFGRDFQSSRVDTIRILITQLLKAQDDFFVKRECEDFFVIGVETRRFYSFDTTRDAAFNDIGGGSCVDYVIQRIPGTNAFMVAVEERNCGSTLCFCSSICNNCESFALDACDCPCYCREECLTRSVPMICPAPAPSTVNYAIAVGSEAPSSSDTCFNQNCNCRTTQTSCLGVRECSWCVTEQKCVYLTECCDSTNGLGSCCTSSPQLNRFEDLRGPTGTCDLQETCIAGNDMTSVCPVNSTAVVAGVVGGFFAVLLIAFIVALVIWYQVKVIRSQDPKDETSRESAFDFSKKRTQATNPTSNDVLSQDSVNKSSPHSEPSSAALVEEKKTDLTVL